jgi:hypothetical protein
MKDVPDALWGIVWPVKLWVFVRVGGVPVSRATQRVPYVPPDPHVVASVVGNPRPGPRRFNVIVAFVMSVVVLVFVIRNPSGARSGPVFAPFLSVPYIEYSVSCLIVVFAHACPVHATAITPAIPRCQSFLTSLAKFGRLGTSSSLWKNIESLMAVLLLRPLKGRAELNRKYYGLKLSHGARWREPASADLDTCPARQVREVTAHERAARVP